MKRLDSHASNAGMAAALAKGGGWTHRGMTMTTDTPAWTRDNEGWLVRVKVGGRIQEVRCTTESQARYFATVLAMNPPKPSKLRN
ncbi:hypothetical protein GCM10012319_45490 [Comamonas sp. KCTC 72670]|nr:hypothetical protein GCM10012319_45490 [Comamonas sp. KCTC 72670]